MRDVTQTAIIARQDVREFLWILAAYKVRYLVIGGCAVMMYVKSRYTSHIDIWVAKDQNNAKAVFRVLEDFGAPLAGITKEDFCQPGHFYQMGIPPLRIDDMLSTRGVAFDDAWEERKMMPLDGLEIPIIGKKHLIQSKLAAGRPQDILDIENLLKSDGRESGTGLAFTLSS